MADLSLAAACTYVDPEYDALFVPKVDPRTWRKPTLHISLHCPVALYLNSYGSRRLQLAFFFHSRLTTRRLTDDLVPLSPKRPHAQVDPMFPHRDFRYRSVPSHVMEPSFQRFLWTGPNKRAMGLGAHPLVAKFIVDDFRLGHLAAKPLELVVKGMEFLAAEANQALADHFSIQAFAGTSSST